MDGLFEAALQAAHVAATQKGLGAIGRTRLMQSREPERRITRSDTIQPKPIIMAGTGCRFEARP